MRLALTFAAGFAFALVVAWGSWRLHFRYGYQVARAADVPADPTLARPEPRLGSHLAIIERHKREAVGVLFIGDSITAGWREVSWVWDDAFGRVQASNAGVDSDQTGNVLWRIQNGELDGIKPRVIVLLIGTNNIGIGHDTGAQAAVGVARVVAEVRERLPKSRILLLGLLPRHDQFAAEVPKCNAVLSTFDVTYFDPGSQLTESDFSDALHLSPTGYRHLADLIGPKIAELYSSNTM